MQRAIAVVVAPRERGKKERAFFFEKKNQKTSPIWWCALAVPPEENVTAGEGRPSTTFVCTDIPTAEFPGML
jgi:hypothetical protein